jgi:hypothetical protein
MTLPYFIVRHWERRVIQRDILLRRLEPQRLVVAMHLNRLIPREANLFRHRLKAMDPAAHYQHVQGALHRATLRGHPKFSGVVPLLESMTGLAMGRHPVQTAKAVEAFTKEFPNFIVMGGVMDNNYVVNRVRSLPPVPQLHRTAQHRVRLSTCILTACLVPLLRSALLRSLCVACAVLCLWVWSAGRHQAIGLVRRGR